MKHFLFLLFALPLVLVSCNPDEDDNELSGCMDPDAVNFNTEATVDDGSCVMELWMQLGQDIDGEAADDFSGGSVSLSSDGTVVAIGARLNDGNGDGSGHTRIYSWNGSTWSQLGADIDGEAQGDYSGDSVSLSSDGTVVAIGAGYNDGNGDGSGHTRIYSIN
jgi:hypothetical protein